MKFKSLISVTTNKANNQISFNLKRIQLKKMGITPEQLLESKIRVPPTKIEKKKEGILKWKK